MPRASSHAVAALFGLIVGSIVGGIVYGLTNIEWPAVCSGVAIAGMIYYAKIHPCKRSEAAPAQPLYEGPEDTPTVITICPSAPPAPVIMDEDPC
jgi:hypothetical protein